MLKQLEYIATLPTIRLGMRIYLLTMVRKSELQDAVWDEVDFQNSVWTILHIDSFAKWRALTIPANNYGGDNP